MPKETITDIVAQPAILGAPKAPSVTLTVSALDETVIGAPFASPQGVYEALSLYLDDVSNTFGPDLYKKMRLDPQLSSAGDVLKASVMARGITLTPAVNSNKDPDYKQAKEIADFSTRAFSHMETPLADVMAEMLNAIFYGYTIAEKTYQYPEAGPDKDKLVFKSIKVKPHNCVTYVVDAFRNVIGILGIRLGQAVGLVPITGLSALITASQLENVLPPDKFCWISVDPENSDPRGNSRYRRAYSWWLAKQHALTTLLKFLDQSAVPSLIGFMPERASVKYAQDELGQEGPPDATTGLLVKNKPSQRILNALVSIRNASAIVLPFGTTVKEIQSQSNGQVFFKTFEECDRQMAKALLLQTLTTQESAHMSRASAGIHQDTLATFIAYLKHQIEAMITTLILRPLIELNYGKDLVYLTPTASLGQVEQRDFGDMARAVAALLLTKSDIITPSMFPYLRRDMGLPAADVTETSDTQISEENPSQDLVDAAQAKALDLAKTVAQIKATNASAKGKGVSGVNIKGSGLPSDKPPADKILSRSGRVTPPEGNIEAPSAASLFNERMIGEIVSGRRQRAA